MTCFVSTTSVALGYDRISSRSSCFVTQQSARVPALLSPPTATVIACAGGVELSSKVTHGGNSTPADAQATTGSDFEEQVQELKHELGRLTEEIDVLSKAERKREKVIPQTIFEALSSSSDVGETATGEWWSPEEKALLSVVEEDIVELESSSDVEAIADAVFSLADDYASIDAKAKGRGSEDDSASQQTYNAAENAPQELKTQNIKRGMRTVQMRRERLAPDPDNTKQTQTLSGAELAGEGRTDFPISDVLLNVQNDFIFSLSRARIVDFTGEAHSGRVSALTSVAEKLTAELTRFPSAYRPFFALQESFTRKNTPTCARCGGPINASPMIDTGPICKNCYVDIYLQVPPSEPQSFSDNTWENGEYRAYVKGRRIKTVENAVKVSRGLLDGMKLRTRHSPPDVSLTNMSVSGSPARDQSAERVARGLSESRSGQGKYSNGADRGDNRQPPHSRGSRLEDGWRVEASTRSKRTINPIRNLVQNITVQPNPQKDVIKLSVGDPTVYGNLKVSEKALSRYCEIIQSGKGNGYSLSMGSLEARSAVANRYTTPQSPLTADDVILSSGTSGSIELAFGAIANPGDNILLPRPGFPLFVTIAAGFDIECRFYRVDPENNWEIMLSDLTELADDRTAAIVVNNPSNPCGSVYSLSHIDDLLATAYALRLPIVADEVYADMVFSGREFESIGSRSTDVPVLCLGGISKQFVVPGWRVGWVLIHDRDGIFEAGSIRQGLRQLTTRMLVPNTPAQGVVPTLLELGTADPAFKAVMRELEMNAQFTVKSLENAKGLRVIEPRGSMYVMAEVDVELLGLKDDMEFTEKLLEEESVFVLPGQCFQAPNFVRIVFAAPQKVLSEAFYRIRTFCSTRAGGM